MAYRVIDPKTLPRYSSFKYFSTFLNPCYGFDVEMDITNIFNLSKYRDESVFINLLYIICVSLNDIPEMRMRMLNNELIIHDTINPAYTVMTDLGAFENCVHQMTYDYEKFYEFAKEEIENHKHINKIKESYNDSLTYDEFYISCVPWLAFNSMTHPIPIGDKSNCSVPRIVWGKFYERERHIYMMLNITVSHAIVDGKQLSDAFNLIQDNLNKASKICHRNA